MRAGWRRPPCNAPPAKLTISVAPGLPPVSMDRVQVQQALVTLIANAAEAVAGRERREIGLSVWRDGNALRCDVADTGCGLPEDVAKGLFEPFGSTELMGMGLGLPIARQIVGDHRGTLWFSANTPEGTVASFTLALGDGATTPA